MRTEGGRRIGTDGMIAGKSVASGSYIGVACGLGLMRRRGGLVIIK